MTSIAVIDHGAGNLVSMVQALRRVGAEPRIVATSSDLDHFDGVILPGVGATGAAMSTLSHRGLIDPLLAYEGPLLGVCVGMQILVEHSDEDDNPCLGIIPGTVRRLPARTLPHMGWNEVSGRDDPLLAGLPDPAAFYFVHSYAVVPDDPSAVAGTTTIEEAEFTSVIRSGRIAGVQFHPERSGRLGLSVLASFVDGCREVERVA